MNVKSFICILVVLSISCTREKKETSSVVFELPASVQQKSSFSLLSLEDIDDDFDFFDSWSTIVPSGIDTGDHPINCYAVMVGGPELAFKKNYCGRKTAADSEEIEKMFSFGPWLGAIPVSSANTQIEMEVPAGADRVFYLVGFHALTASACTDFRKTSPSQAELTRPHIISQVGRVNLEAGSSTVVNMVRSLDTEKWFDECKFTDGSSDDDKKQASVIAVSKVSPPEESLVESADATTTNGRCAPFKIRLMDEHSRQAQHDQNIKVRLQGCITGSSVSDCYDPTTQAYLAAPITIDSYANYASCSISAQGDGQDEFDIPANNISVIRWLRNPVSGAENAYVQAIAVNPPTVFREKRPDKFVVRSDEQTTVHITGPTNIIANQCYKYNIRHVTHVFASTTVGVPLGSVSIEVKDASTGEWNTLSGPSRVFMDSMCTNSFTSSAYSSWISTDVYVSVPASYDLRVVASASGADSDYHRIIAVTGSTTPRHLRIQGQQTIKNGECEGPMTLSMLNEAGSVVKSAVSTGNIFTLDPLALNSNINNLSFYSDGMCSTPITSVFQIPMGATEKEFFIRSNADGDGQRNLRLRSSTGLVGGIELRLFGENL